MDPTQDQPIQNQPVQDQAPLDEITQDEDYAETDNPVDGGLQQTLENLSDLADEVYETAEESSERLADMEADYAEITRLYDEAVGGGTPSSAEETPVNEMLDAETPAVGMTNPVETSAPTINTMPLVPATEEIVPAVDQANPLVQESAPSMDLPPVPTKDGNPLTEVPMTPVVESPMEQVNVPQMAPMGQTSNPEPVTPLMPWQQGPTGSQQPQQ